MKTHEMIRCGVLTGLTMLTLLACGGSEDDRAGTEPPATTSTTRPAAATVTLISVESGDAACYLEVEDAAGTEETLAAAFELCPGGERDASGLVGRKVVLERRPGEILADSCEGNPECKESKTVDLVVEVKAAS